MKKTAAFLVAIFSLQAHVWGASSEAFTFNSIQRGDQTLYPLRTVSEKMGYAVRWDNVTNGIMLSDGENAIVIRLKSGTYTRNNEILESVSAPLNLNGVTYVDASVLRRIFDLELNPQGEFTRRIAEASGFTRNELIDTAIATDRDLRVLKNALSRSEAVNQDAELNVTNALYQLPYYGSGTTEQALSAAWQGVLGSQIRVELSERAIENRMDVLRIQVEGQYNSLIALTNSIRTLRTAAVVAQSTFDQAQLRYDAGLISQIDYQKAKLALESANASVLINESKMAEALNELSLLTSVPVKELQLSEANVLHPLGDFSIDSALLDVRKNSYALFSLDKSRMLAKYGLDYYVFNAGQEPYKAKAIDLSNAEIELEKELERERKVMLNTWQQIIQIELNYSSINLQEQQTLKELEALRLQVDLGMATELQYKTAYLGLQQLRDQKELLVVQHSALKNVLNRPWLSQ